MNQIRWSSLAAAMLLSTLSLMPASQAKDVKVITLSQDGSPLDPVSQSEEASGKLPSTSSPTPVFVSDEGDSNPNATPDAIDLSSAAQDVPETSPVKVGAVQSDLAPRTEQDIVAHVVPHEYNHQRAATLYVRDIPVLTFLDRQGQSVYPDTASYALSPTTLVSPAQQDKNLPGARKAASGSSPENTPTEMDPVWQASRVAAGINELSRQLSDTEITVRWDADRSAYRIVQGETEIARIDLHTILPDTTGNWEQDALQATNRLRRLLHQDPPLRQLDHSRFPVAAPARMAAAPRQVLNGWASWYGPGFHGAYSASGEVFNPQAMTAAHLSLPFGTQVRVTNLDNGRSVIVRINDRGPYVGGRILDVSEGAAYALGMLQSGVVPVKVDVLP